MMIRTDPEPPMLALATICHVCLARFGRQDLV